MKTAIINTKIVMADYIIPDGTIVIEDGIIVDFGKKISTEGMEIIDAKGAYTGQIREELLVIVTKQEYRKLMDFINKVDPKAFVTVYSVNEVCYQPKMKKNRE